MAFATAREAGNAGQQSQCIGMSRPIVYPVHRTFLHQSSRVHDAYAVAETCHHTQVMGNVENGRTDLLLEIRQEVQHHRLSSHIQSRGGFIQDEQIWVRHQGHGDDTTLYHPPGELVWIPGHNGRRIRHLHRVQMPDPPSVMARYPHQLSGGMVQRCVIAMGLMADPDLLILDEPTTALDVTTQAVVLDLLADLKQEIGASILYITHDLGVVAGLCDRIGVMYSGRLVEKGPVDRIYDRPRHPYTLGLLACIPRFTRGRERHTLPEIPGSIPRPEVRLAGCVFAPRCPMAAELCGARLPGLREVSPGHDSACFFWEDVPPPEIGLHPVPELKWEDKGGRVKELLEAEGLVKDYESSSGWGSLFWRHRKMLRAVDGVDVAVHCTQHLPVPPEK